MALLSESDINFIKNLKQGESLYDLLGLEVDASQDAIKRNYHDLSLIYHPDRQKDIIEMNARIAAAHAKQSRSDPLSPAERKRYEDAQDEFKRLAFAYGILSDPGKRADYHSLFLYRQRAAPRTPPQIPKEKVELSIGAGHLLQWWAYLLSNDFTFTNTYGAEVFNEAITRAGLNAQRFNAEVINFPKYTVTADTKEDISDLKAKINDCAEIFFKEIEKIMKDKGATQAGIKTTIKDDKSAAASGAAVSKSLTLSSQNPAVLQMIVNKLNELCPGLLEIDTSTNMSAVLNLDKLPLRHFDSREITTALKSLNLHAYAVPQPSADPQPSPTTAQPSAGGTPGFYARWARKGEAPKKEEAPQPSPTTPQPSTGGAPGFYERWAHKGEASKKEEAPQPSTTTPQPSAGGTPGFYARWARKGEASKKEEAPQPSPTTPQPSAGGAPGFYERWAHKGEAPKKEGEENILFYKAENGELAVKFPNQEMRNQFASLLGSAPLSEYQKHIYKGSGLECPIKLKGEDEVLFIPAELKALPGGSPDQQQLAAVFATLEQKNKFYELLGLKSVRSISPHKKLGTLYFQDPILFDTSKTLSERNIKISIPQALRPQGEASRPKQ